jgi:hypothetical protein
MPSSASIMTRARPLTLAAELLALRLLLPRRLANEKLDDVVRALSPLGPRQSSASVRALEISMRIVEAVLRRARVVPDTCLYRSLARFAVLRRAGIDARFLMGVRSSPTGVGIAGHAWLEVDGKPRGEPDLLDYAITFAYPP